MHTYSPFYFFGSGPNTASTSGSSLRKSGQAGCEDEPSGRGVSIPGGSKFSEEGQGVRFSSRPRAGTREYCCCCPDTDTAPSGPRRRNNNGSVRSSSSAYPIRSPLEKEEPSTIASHLLPSTSFSEPPPPTPSPTKNPFTKRFDSLKAQYMPNDEQINDFLWRNRTVVTAGSASLFSTIASFPFDSVKSRLQVKEYPRPAIWNCARAVAKEEGFGGFFRGVTIPLITITFVRTASFSIYYGTKDKLHERGILADTGKLWHTALSGAAGGATSGVLISCGSAPFELVKVQRQLEYLIAVQNGLLKTDKSGAANHQQFVGGRYKAQNGFQAAAAIWRNHRGMKGFYIGFPLHLMRDTLGTTLYFGFYDTMRSLVQRYSTGDGRSGPQLFGVPGPVVSFLTGSTAGIFSWLLVYPVDLLKTNVQKRELQGNSRKLTGWQLFLRVMAERPPPEGKTTRDTFPRRFLRLYRGLGVSALRSFISHGMTWSLIESISGKISQRVGKQVSYVPGVKHGETSTTS